MTKKTIQKIALAVAVTIAGQNQAFSSVLEEQESACNVLALAAAANFAELQGVEGSARKSFTSKDTHIVTVGETRYVVISALDSKSKYGCKLTSIISPD